MAKKRLFVIDTEVKVLLGYVKGHLVKPLVNHNYIIDYVAMYITKCYVVHLDIDKFLTNNRA